MTHGSCTMPIGATVMIEFIDNDGTLSYAAEIEFCRFIKHEI